MCTHCERVANTQTPASGKKKKSTRRRLMHGVGAVSCEGGNSPFGQIRQLSSQQMGGRRVGRAAWLLTCCKVLIRCWTSVGLVESTRGARSVRWRLSTPASTHHSTLCLVSKHTHTRTPDQIRSSRPKLRRQLAWCVCTQKNPALPARVELGAHGLGSTCNGEM